MWTGGGGEGNWGAWPLQQSAYANLPHQKGTRSTSYVYVFMIDPLGRVLIHQLYLNYAHLLNLTHFSQPYIICIFIHGQW